MRLLGHSKNSRTLSVRDESCLLFFLFFFSFRLKIVFVTIRNIWLSPDKWDIPGISWLTQGKSGTNERAYRIESVHWLSLRSVLPGGLFLGSDGRRFLARLAAMSMDTEL